MLRRVAAKLLMGVGAVALLVAVAGVVGAGLAVRRGFSTRDEPSAVERWLASAARRAAASERANRLVNPAGRTRTVLGAARAHWADHCALCHANDGSGDTPIGKNLYPRAPDMRRPSTQQLSDGALYTIIKEGVRLTGMPAWGEPGEHDRESWGLVSFIRHLPSLTPAEEQEMRTLNPKSAHELQEKLREEEFLDEKDGEEKEP